jgi:uncharacterized protein YbcI
VPQVEQQPTSILASVSNAMVALHKEQFGRGPTSVHSHFASSNALVCVLEDVLLPAERKMVEMGEHQRVRESRLAFQIATRDDFIVTVERIVGRKVRAFASSTDVHRNVVFENYLFEPDGGDRTPPLAGVPEPQPDST